MLLLLLLLSRASAAALVGGGDDGVTVGGGQDVVEELEREKMRTDWSRPQEICNLRDARIRHATEMTCDVVRTQGLGSSSGECIQRA